MTHLSGNRVAILALAGLLGACGGGKEEGTQLAQSSVYAGTVADEDGKPVAGVSIQLENRTTDKITQVLSAADGSFSAAVEPGVYDVIFDDPNAMQYVSVQQTAVDLRASRAVRLQLSRAQPLTRNTLNGTARYQDGKPAAHRQLLIEPAIAHTSANQDLVEVPDAVLVETDAQGRFSQELGQQDMDLAFDVTLIAANAPGLDMHKLTFGYNFVSQQARSQFFDLLKNFIARYAEESVNIRKPNGPMQLDLSLGADVRNLRSATGTSNGIPVDAQELIAYNNTSPHPPPELLPVETGSPKENGFTLSRGSALAEDTPRVGKFFGGKLDVTAPCDYRSFKQITDPASGTFDTLYSRNTQICLTNSSSVVYAYKLNIKTDRASTYKFTDDAGDRYSLKIGALRLKEVHEVRYNSQKPAIVDILFNLPN